MSRATPQSVRSLRSRFAWGRPGHIFVAIGVYLLTQWRQRVLMRVYRHFPFLNLGRIQPEQRAAFQIQILLLFAISTLLYIGFPGTRHWRVAAEQEHMATMILGWDGLAWYVWLAAAPVMMYLIRRYPVSRADFWRPLSRIIFWSVVLYLVVTHVRFLLRILPLLALGPKSPAYNDLDLDSYAFNTFAMMPLDFLTYCGFFAVSVSIDYYFKLRQRNEEALQLQVRTARLQSELARAELAALRGQLHPHFLFNSFNAIATLVRQQKNEVAVEIIAQLSALLRLAIDRTGLQEIPLHQEIDFIRRYLDIEQVRFGDKLHVEIALEAGTMNALVPNIVLQPLVENSIKHGISLRTTPGAVRVKATRSGERLRIEIADDGADDLPPAGPAPGGKKSGIGLANARAQLDKLYGADYRLEISPQCAGGTIVTLNLPWRQSPET